MGILSTLAKNPTLIALGALGIGLFVFRDKISDFFSNITGGAETANLLGENLLSNLQGTQDLLLGINKFFTDFKFPTFEDFEFPSFEFPEFKFEFPSFDFGGLFGPGPMMPQKMVEDTGLFTPAQLAECQCGSSIVQDAFGNVNQVCKQCAKPLGPDPNLAKEPSDAELFAKDFPETFQDLTPAQMFAVQDKGVDIKSFLVDQPLQQFQGFGPSFQGGSIFETPIENLSLSQIIDKFMVTASQAANLKAIAEGFTPEEEKFLQGSQDVIGFTGFNPPAVSDPQFQGLTPEEIALQLTGGNIQNF